MREQKLKIQVKRVYDRPQATDGYRVLVDRLWPRGIKKQDLCYDLWDREVAPSTEVRKAFGHRPENFAQFRQDYQAELKDSGRAEQLLAQVKAQRAGTLTLLIAAKDQTYNHGNVLRDFLEELLSCEAEQDRN